MKRVWTTLLAVIMLSGCFQQDATFPATKPVPGSPVSRRRTTPVIIAETGRTVTGRIILGYGDRRPVAGAQLQLESGGEFLAETDADGRFTLHNVSPNETVVYARHLHFIIPAGKEELLDLGDIEYPLVHPPDLRLADYPPSGTPYRIEDGDFWLVHTPEDQLYSFASVSPEYANHITVDGCRFVWVEAVKRFVDPCSGDEWELDGRLNLAHSTELWSNRDLDRYVITVEDGMIYVHLDRQIPGPSRMEPPRS